MSKEEKNKIVPKLRFPEFKDGDKWNIELLGELYSFKVTNSFSRDNLNYASGDVKDIHYGDIHTKFSTLFDITKERVPFINPSISIEKINQECYCVEGDLIFADASEDLEDVGKSIEIVNLNNEKLLSGLHTLLARQIEPKLVARFGGHLFMSDGIRTQIQREAQGSKVLGISGTRLSNIKIYYPRNKKEQQKIADCLSSLDEIITVQSQKLEAIKAHKKGLMQQLFPTEGETVPKLRFAEFRDSGDWRMREFDEILEITRLAGYEYSEYWEEDLNKEIIALRGYNIGKGKLELSNLGYISNNLSLKLIRSRLSKGDIVYPCVGTIGNAAVIEEDNKYHIQQNIAKLTPKKDVSPYFISQFLMSDLGLSEVNRFNATSSQPNVLVGSLRKFQIRIPDHKEQQKISDCLSSLDELITAQAEKIEALKRHKKGLMQGLFPDNI